MNWPSWWEWEIEITPHVEKRMEQRDFTEIDVREMSDRARGYGPDQIEGRTIHRLARCLPTSNDRRVPRDLGGVPRTFPFAARRSLPPTPAKG